MANYKRKKHKNYRGKRSSWKHQKAHKSYKYRNKQRIRKALKSGEVDVIVFEKETDKTPH